MKVLTAEQMREVDRRTIEDGVPSIALMENAAHRVVEEMVREFDPIDRQSIVILCGKGNNGGDGLAIARLLHEYNVGGYEWCWRRIPRNSPATPRRT